MLLYYRFSSEHAGSYRQCALSSSALSLGEAKQLLADHCGLAREYLRKIDFRIFLAGERKKTQQHGGSSGSGSGAGEEELVEVVDEHQMIHAYSHLVVQRVGLVGERAGGIYVHTLAKRQLSKDAWRTDEEIHLQRTGAAKKKPLPPEWLCGLCGGVMTQPVLVKCLGTCTQSACRSCLEAALRAARGACPFCAAGFRQVIRNKRLEEIINRANLQEFESPPALVAGNRPGIAREQSRKGGGGGSEDAGGIKGKGTTGAGAIKSSSNSNAEDNHIKTGGNAVVLLQQAATRRGDRGATGASAQMKAMLSGGSIASQKDAEQGEPATESTHCHFVYLLSQKNFQLMRTRDMMLVEPSSALAAALEPSSKSSQNGGDTVTGSETAPALSGRSADMDHHCGGSRSLLAENNTDSDADIEGRDAFLVSLCAAGGGTSFCVGGFVRINSHNKVEISTDRVAQNVVRQWQQVSATQGGRDGEDATSANVLVYRVNWLEKYGTMPMLPARKQPLGGLVGGSRRTASAGFGISSNNNASSFPAGLVQRTSLPCGTLEVVVAPSKYEDVLASIRDYAQFGSRSTDPWQHPGSSGTGTAPTVSAPAAVGSAPVSADAANSAPGSQPAPPAPSHRLAPTTAGVDTKDRSTGTEIHSPPVPPPPPPLPPGVTPLTAHHDRGRFSSEANATFVKPGENVAVPGGTAAAFGGTTTLDGSGVGREIHADLSSTQDSTRPEGDDELHTGIPASLGPPPLDLHGGPGDEANPYVGYCAILPFLTEEQFWHIRRMQKKAIRLCGYKRPHCRESTRSSSSTSSSSTSSRESRHRRRGRRRPHRRKRHRVYSTESSTGSDSSFGSTDSEDQVRGQHESTHDKRSMSQSSEVISKEAPTGATMHTASRPVSDPTGEVTATSQASRQDKEGASEAVEEDTTASGNQSVTSSVQQSETTPACINDAVNPAKHVRTRSVVGKLLPFVPPPLSTKHSGNSGSPSRGLAPNAKIKACSQRMSRLNSFHVKSAASKQLEKETLNMENQISRLKCEQKKNIDEKSDKARWCSGRAEAPLRGPYVLNVLRKNSNATVAVPPRQQKAPPGNSEGGHKRSINTAPKAKVPRPPFDKDSCVVGRQLSKGSSARGADNLLPAASSRFWHPMQGKDPAYASLGQSSREHSVPSSTAGLPGQSVSTAGLQQSTLCDSSCQIKPFLDAHGFQGYLNNFLACGVTCVEDIFHMKDSQIEALKLPPTQKLRFSRKIAEFKQSKCTSPGTAKPEAGTDVELCTGAAEPSQNGYKHDDNLSSVSSAVKAALTSTSVEALIPCVQPPQKSLDSDPPLRLHDILWERKESESYSKTALEAFGSVLTTTTTSLQTPSETCESSTDFARAASVADAACEALPPQGTKAKAACYNCYRLFEVPLASKGRGSSLRQFCSVECGQVYETQQLEFKQFRKKIVDDLRGRTTTLKHAPALELLADGQLEGPRPDYDQPTDTTSTRDSSSSNKWRTD